MDRLHRIKLLKQHLYHNSNVNHHKQIMELDTLKDAHVYCIINRLNSQTYGPLLENFIRVKFNYTKNKSFECRGDFSKSGKNTEVKVSLGGKTCKKFNFVQIRPSHECHNYILTAYNLSIKNVENEGELYIFRIPKSGIKNVIELYGGYSHGTLKEYGKITKESLSDENVIREYSLRPTINDKCWNHLLQFRISESEL